MDVTIVICTYNRCQYLRETLASLARVRVPEKLRCELLIVDNGSTDQTSKVVRSSVIAKLPIRYVYEPKRGKGNAYNAAIAQSQGEILLFTDDDVRLPHNWITDMCEPIWSRNAHAVAGGVKIASHLERSWMTSKHRSWLASTERLNPNVPEDLVGANMAISRKVLNRVPEFDVELGPGAMGFGEDTLFSWQLKEAGFSLASKLDALVEHHCEESRLSRVNFLDRAKKEGQVDAYIAYHWEHKSISFLRLRLLKAKLRLRYLQWKNKRELSSSEGIPEWEIGVVAGFNFYRQYLTECKRNFNYERRGLIKRGSL
ncbi:MAG: glycosyltransferase family 2 protein [Pyrinomonadaceae bacterium]|nr:glycosyltransferase family 2 protein [Pyrinomonadaceae bacterium]